MIQILSEEPIFQEAGWRAMVNGVLRLPLAALRECPVALKPTRSHGKRIQDVDVPDLWLGI